MTNSTGERIGKLWNDFNGFQGLMHARMKTTIQIVRCHPKVMFKMAIPEARMFDGVLIGRISMVW